MKTGKSQRIHLGRTGAIALVILLVHFSACSKSSTQKNSARNDSSESLSNHDDSESQDNDSDESTENRTLIEKTGGMIKQATDTSLEAAGNAGVWIKDTVQDSISSGTNATVNAGKAIRDMFQMAKEQGTTTATNVADFVKEDISRLGSWQYTSRTLTNEDPNEVITMLNRMGREKWECFWVDKKPMETTLYFKKTPRSYVSSIPFKDLIRYLPELAGGGQ